MLILMGLFLHAEKLAEPIFIWKDDDRFYGRGKNNY